MKVSFMKSILIQVISYTESLRDCAILAQKHLCTCCFGNVIGLNAVMTSKTFCIILGYPHGGTCILF